MRGNEFLDKMELIDPAYIEAADALPKKEKNAWIKWVAAAACLCLIVGAATMLYRLNEHPTAPTPVPLVLSDKTTAKVSYGYDGTSTSDKALLAGYTEEEMFALENMYIFRGRVSGLCNITIDFQYAKTAKCIATVIIDQVYKGDLVVGEEIKMLLPCPIGVDAKMEDTGIIKHIEVGTEGIFMPTVYDENSFAEMFGLVVMKRDLASCGIADGMRWVFLDTDKGLLFLHSAYPGAKDATDLDDIEEYVREMLK